MSPNDDKQSSGILVAVIILIVIGMLLAWKFIFSEQNDENINQIAEEPAIVEAPIEEVLETLPLDNSSNIEPEELMVELPNSVEETVISEEVIKPLPIIPALNDSDSWVQKKLPTFIWKQELLRLFINEDMIRRFVVFVDNFAQGNVAYSHSPFIKPAEPFAVKEQTLNNPSDETTQTIEFDESSFKRFSIYVDLLRAVDTDVLVEWYKDIQPLITESYEELGYPDREFKQVLQQSISKVLDLEFPKGEVELVRPSVMYRYKSQEIEALDDADKLMLRIGKDNLLIIKSVLLEINEKLNQID